DSMIRNNLVFELKYVVCLWFLVFAPAQAQKTGAPARRLYVEPFAMRQGSEELESSVIQEVRKLPSVSLAPDESSADLILGGGGEIWTRGYRSFSPRSHMKIPANGTPIYGGYLSIELKNKAGETLWSYLVTPGTGSSDISKDLSKKIAKQLDDALNMISVV